MGNIKDLLNGEPFNARIVNNMVEVWLRHTERLCHFSRVMELFTISASIFEIKRSFFPNVRYLRNRAETIGSKSLRTGGGHCGGSGTTPECRFLLGNGAPVHGHYGTYRRDHPIFRGEDRGEEAGKDPRHTDKKQTLVIWWSFIGVVDIPQQEQKETA